MKQRDDKVLFKKETDLGLVGSRVNVQLVSATRASTTFPMCSLRLRSATAREISISDTCSSRTRRV